MLLEDTIHAIRQADIERRRARARELRLRLPVARVDALLRELEEIHLRGGVKVPASMIRRIEETIAALPPGFRDEFPLRTTITRVMDHLYAIQDRLLTQKDGERLRLRETDRDLDDDFPAA